MHNSIKHAQEKVLRVSTLFAHSAGEKLVFCSLRLDECHLLGVGFTHRTRVNVTNSPQCPVGSLSEENSITEKTKKRRQEEKEI